MYPKNHHTAPTHSATTSHTIIIIFIISIILNFKKQKTSPIFYKICLLNCNGKNSLLGIDLYAVILVIKRKIKKTKIMNKDQLFISIRNILIDKLGISKSEVTP